MTETLTSPFDPIVRTQAVQDASVARTTALASSLSRRRDGGRRAPRRRRWLVLALVVVLAAAGAVAWYLLRPYPVETTAVAYQRAGAAAHPVLRMSGYVTYPRLATVGAAARTPVTRLTFQEGDHVQAGQVLAVFESREVEAQRQVQQVALNDARLTLERTERLHAAGAASAIDLQAARTQVETLRAQIGLLEAQLANTVVRAPFAGRVTEQLVEVGEVVTRGICTLVDDSHTLVAVDVNQEDIARLTPEQPGLVTLDAYPETEYAARVYQIKPKADLSKNTVRVELEVLQPDARFAPEMSAKVFFTEETRQANEAVRAVLAVDTSAVVRQGGRAFVWQVVDGRLHRAEIQTGEALSGLVEVTSGLKADDRVVLDARQPELKENLRVSVAAE